VMEKYREIYTGFEWHLVDEARGQVVFYVQNRRDHPSGKGTCDFPGVSIITYAGNGKWSREEDYWAVKGRETAMAEYEAARQTAALDRGERIVQETRLWNAKKEITDSMRSKEEAADYRYFPEPDLVPFVIKPAVIEHVRAQLPELPAARRARFQERFELSAYDAGVIAQDRALADLFEQALVTYPKPKPVANWIMGDLSAYLNARGVGLADVKLRPEWLGHLLQLIEGGTLSGKMAKEVFQQTLEQGADPVELVQQGGLRQIVDVAALERIAEEVMAAFPKSVEDYAKGKANALMYLVGQAMKRSQGKANPQQMTEILKRRLEQTNPAPGGVSA